MALTGGIAFYLQNYALAKNGASNTASTGDVVSDYCLDTNPITYWNSVGSNDATTETLQIRFTSALINRIFLQDHNFKNFSIQYWNGSSFVSFTNVVALTGSLSGISETSCALSTSYYEFDAVTTALIKVTINTTQTTDVEKYLAQFIATSELGTLVGHPLINNVNFSRNPSAVKMLSGKQRVIKSYSAFSCKLSFKNYPNRLTADLDLVGTLFDSENPFLVWLCGGKYLSTSFPYALRGFRLVDILQCQISSDLPLSYSNNVTTLQLNADITLVEHV